MHGDNVAVLDAEVVAHDTVDAGASIIQIIIGKDDQNSVLPFLALHQNCVTPEELEGLHGVVRQGNNRVIIVDGIGDAIDELSVSGKAGHSKSTSTYINELGFFFFLRIAVEVSSSCCINQYRVFLRSCDGLV